MKQQEQAKILIKLIKKELTNKQAASRLGLSVRQTQRKKQAFLKGGLESLIHKSKGRSSKCSYAEELKLHIIELYRSEFPGWNFKHFHEKLEPEFSLQISYSSVYRSLTDYNFISPRKKKHKPKVHPPRARRENAGELVQVDASKHYWLGGDEYYHLHGAIDDATGIVTACVLQKEETSLGYQLVLAETIRSYGIPAELYTDYRTVFQPNQCELSLEEELAGKTIQATRFSRMLERLGVGIKSTMVPQAKGRIERLWGSFQDRLIKELARANITTIEEANHFIANSFLPDYNKRFASTIDSNRNYFTPVAKDFDYNLMLAISTSRQIQHHCYIKLDNIYYVIEKDNRPIHINTKDKLEVFLCLDGSKRLLYQGNYYNLRAVRLDEIKERESRKQSLRSPAKTAAELSEVRRQSALKSNTPWRQTNAKFFIKKEGVTFSLNNRDDIFAGY